MTIRLLPEEGPMGNARVCSVGKRDRIGGRIVHAYQGRRMILGSDWDHQTPFLAWNLRSGRDRERSGFTYTPGYKK